VIKGPRSRALSDNTFCKLGMRAVQGRRSHRCVRPRNARNASGVVDYRRAAPFRALAREVGESAAALAHRHALSMPGVATIILRVKDRMEFSVATGFAAVAGKAEAAPVSDSLLPPNSCGPPYCDRHGLRAAAASSDDQAPQLYA
jgi:hypothetical protein